MLFSGLVGCLLYLGMKWLREVGGGGGGGCFGDGVIYPKSKSLCTICFVHNYRLFVDKAG